MPRSLCSCVFHGTVQRDAAGAAQALLDAASAVGTDAQAAAATAFAPEQVQVYSH